jgi:hypothetical protein
VPIAEKPVSLVAEVFGEFQKLKPVDFSTPPLFSKGKLDLNIV